MSPSRRDFLRHAALAGLAAPLAGAAGGLRPALGESLGVQPAGPFAPTWESLARYTAPAWFRDAKFGIWAHWGPQCQPERGDWYARKMYLQGDPVYEHHVRSYGHPSRAGFMEVIRRWTAERWDPDALVARFRQAGARYFVAMANHHDNLDLYDSRHHAWNSVRVGPRTDVVGRWARAARAEGLRFGVSNHSAHAWHWYQPAYGYDAEGPLAGVRYDAARLTAADGRGTWWEGLDPQALYTGAHMPLPTGVTTAAAARAWHEAHDARWVETPPPKDPTYARRWLLRCTDLVDRYRPDFLYFDDYELPLGQAGLDAAAHFYNANAAWHGGRLEAVLTAKQLAPAHRTAVVEDVERGFSDALRPLPWQTDTCLGNWHYDRALFERHGYKSAHAVVQRLCDTVSKNGNLLLSVPVRGDGTIDADEEHVLDDLAAWFAVNGPAVYGTRPWAIYGEGPTRVGGVMFGEERAAPFTADDVRFTTRDGMLYALLLGWPDRGAITLRALAEGSPHAPGAAVERVELVAGGGPLAHRRDAAGLTVTLPERRPTGGVAVYVLAVAGRGLVAP